MNTEFLKNTPSGIARAAQILREGGLAAIPTETVYGLGADALNGKAVARIFQAKGRPMDNPLIVHISAWEELDRLAAQIPPQAEKLARAFWPGPLTMIFPKSGLIPQETSAGLDTVAVRMPSHPVAAAVIRKAGVPVAAPSANTSGLPSPTTARRVAEDLDGKIEAILDGGDCQVGVESTVLTLATNPPRLLRPGGVTVEQIEAVIGPIAVDEAVLSKLKEGAVASSPGMKYKHYAPRAHVRIVKGNGEKYRDYVNARQAPGVFALCFEEDIPFLRVPFVAYGREEDGASQAHGLFDALRRLDELGAQEVYARCPAQKGVGLAVYNRLIRAAAFEVIE